MCLHKNFNNPKPSCAKARKYVYKVVRKDGNGTYHNLFKVAEHCQYSLGNLAISNRQEKIANLKAFSFMEDRNITYGFHVVHSKKAAQKIVKQLEKRLYETAIKLGIDYLSRVQSWNGRRLAILKCIVSFENNHVADGWFKDSGLIVPSSVYDILIPVEEIFVADRNVIDVINEKLQQSITDNKEIHNVLND